MRKINQNPEKERFTIKNLALCVSLVILFLLGGSTGIRAQCQADFIYYDTINCHKFKFIDQSLPDTLNIWTWHFQDGSPANYNGKNPPVVTFNTSGDKVITLTVSVTGPGGCSNLKEDTITVPEIPSVDFSWMQDCFEFTFTPNISGVFDSLSWDLVMERFIRF
jgi:hypothetical protein